MCEALTLHCPTPTAGPSAIHSLPHPMGRTGASPGPCHQGQKRVHRRPLAHPACLTSNSCTPSPWPPTYNSRSNFRGELGRPKPQILSPKLLLPNTGGEGGGDPADSLLESQGAELWASLCVRPSSTRVGRQLFKLANLFPTSYPAPPPLQERISIANLSLPQCRSRPPTHTPPRPPPPCSFSVLLPSPTIDYKPLTAAIIFSLFSLHFPPQSFFPSL